MGKAVTKRTGFTLIELMIVVAIISILAAIAIPNLIKFQARSRQGEAKANLKSLFTAQRAYFQEKDRYLETINDLGFGPERGNRYAYWAGGGTWQDRSTLSGTSTLTDSNITVDTFKYQGAATNPPASVSDSCGNADTAAPAGTPFNTSNDIIC